MCDNGGGRRTMRNLIGAMALSLATIAATAPALADTKAGVEAWNRGDYTAAVGEWRKGAVAGDPDAQFNLGQAYKLGRGVPVDLAMAESWYRKAAAQGHAQAEDNYGLALFQDGKPGEALPWLEKSVARDEPRAELVLGTMLFNGDGVERDWVRAYALMTRSSAQGQAQGSQTLAEMDKYISTDQRQKGLALARDYAAKAARPPLPVAAISPAPAPVPPREAPPSRLQPVDVPPSSVAQVRPGAPYPVPGTATATPPAPIAPPPPAPRPRPEPVKAPPPPVAKQAPTPVPAPPKAGPVPAPAPAGKWRVQLGAFRDEGNAKALWVSIQRHVRELSGMQPYLRRVGQVTKLQAGPLASGADAQRVCRAVKSAGQDCLPVAP